MSVDNYYYKKNKSGIFHLGSATDYEQKAEAY
jgi:hypothetical protein